jgi:hypothetical protein
MCIAAVRYGSYQTYESTLKNNMVLKDKIGSPGGQEGHERVGFRILRLRPLLPYTLCFAMEMACLEDLLYSAAVFAQADVSDAVCHSIMHPIHESYGNDMMMTNRMTECILSCKHSIHPLRRRLGLETGVEQCREHTRECDGRRH